MRLAAHDVYLHVAGGLRIQEPAADLAARPRQWCHRWPHSPLPADAVFFGEASLSGAVRPVAQAAARLKEAAKLGFTRAYLPEAARGEAVSESVLTLTTIATLASLVADIAARGKNRGPRLASEDG